MPKKSNKSQRQSVGARGLMGQTARGPGARVDVVQVTIGGGLPVVFGHPRLGGDPVTVTVVTIGSGDTTIVHAFQVQVHRDHSSGYN